MNLDEVMQFVEPVFKEETWIVEVFVVVFLTALINWIQKSIIKKLIAKFETTRTYWDHALFEAASKPLTFLIWILGLSFAADIVKSESDSAIFGAIQPLREVGVIIIIVWFLTRFIQRAEEKIIEKKRHEEQSFDETTADAIAKLLRVSVVITGGLVILQTLGYSISGVLAFGGIGGIAIGFAARDLLANFFGGLTIYMDRPFDVGDWIRSPDKEIEGSVEKIGWRLTTIRTFDKRPLYVPNATFTNVSVENPSRMTNRRIKETIGIRYDDASKMRDVIADVKKMLEQHEDIDNDQTLIVNFNEFAASSLNFFIYTFTKTTNWIEFHQVKQDVMLKIIDIIDAHGAECAFPTTTMHIPDGISISSGKTD
jgi:MscS family membrane protein